MFESTQKSKNQFEDFSEETHVLIKKNKYMKSLQKIIQEISKITLEIEEKYPELYRDLTEMPITLSIPSKNEDTLTTKELSEYLNTLKELLQKEIESHLKK